MRETQFKNVLNKWEKSLDFHNHSMEYLLFLSSLYLLVLPPRDFSPVDFFHVLERIAICWSGFTPGLGQNDAPSHPQKFYIAILRIYKYVAWHVKAELRLQIELKLLNNWP